MSETPILPNRKLHPEGDPRTVRGLLLVCVTLLCAAYAQALTFGFLIDDNQLILGDQRIRHFNCLGSVLRSNFFAGTTASGEFYRPFANAWFMLNYAIFGLQPWGWHLASVLLHLATTFALYVLLGRYFENRIAAAASALLFAVMPIHAEPVLWLSSAGDELATLFLLLALLALDLACTNPRRRPLFLLAATIAYAVCLGSKESATLFLVIFAVALWQRSSGTPARRLAQSALLLSPFVLMDLVFILLRSQVLGRTHIHLQSLSEFFATLPRLTAFYLYKLVFPFFPAEFYNLQRTQSFFSPLSIAACLLLVLVIAAMLYAWFRVPHTRVSLAIIVVPLAPAIAATLFVIDLVHDRYLYLPSVGIAALAGLAFAAFYRSPNTRRPAVLVLLGVAIAMTLDLGIESGKWRDDWTLARASIQSAPNSAEANIFYGNMLLARQHDDLARPYFQRAIDIYPADYWALTQLGDVTLRAGDAPSAERDYQRAIELAARRGTPEGIPFSRLAIIAESRGELPQAISYVQSALKIDPEVPALHQQLAHLYGISGNSAAAQQESASAQVLSSADACHAQ